MCRLRLWHGSRRGCLHPRHRWRWSLRGCRRCIVEMLVHCLHSLVHARCLPGRCTVKIWHLRFDLFVARDGSSLYRSRRRCVVALIDVAQACVSGLLLLCPRLLWLRRQTVVVLLGKLRLRVLGQRTSELLSRSWTTALRRGRTGRNNSRAQGLVVSIYWPLLLLSLRCVDALQIWWSTLFWQCLSVRNVVWLGVSLLVERSPCV